MSSLTGLPKNISDELIDIASKAKLTNNQKRAIKRAGHTWKSILTDTERTIQGLTNLSQEEKRTLLNRCKTLGEALQGYENAPIDKLTYHAITSEEPVSQPAMQKAKKATEKALPPKPAPSSPLDSILLGGPLRAFLAAKATPLLPQAPQNLGLSKEAVSTLEKSTLLMLQYTCQHLVRYENGQEEPPKFIKPFFIEKKGLWVLNETGSALKKSLLIDKEGPLKPDKDHLTGLTAIILTNIYSLLGNFKKASEKGFSLPQDLGIMLQKALSPPQKGEQRPPLQSVSDQLADHLLSQILPGKSKDITILAGLDTIVYGLIEKKIHDGFCQALCKLESRLNSSQQPLSSAESENTEQKPEEESLADLMSETIFPESTAVELNSLIGNIPGVALLLPGFSSLQAAQKDKILPTPISDTPLSSVIGELATTTILGALPKNYYQETIATSKERLENKGITHPEVVRQMFDSLLEKMESALNKYEGSALSPPTLFLKLFSQDPEEKYHRNAWGALILPILKNPAAKEALTSYVEAASLYLIDTLCSKIAEGDLTVPGELLTPGKSKENRAEAVTNFLLKRLDLGKIPLPPLLTPLQPFLEQVISEPLKKQISSLLPQIDTLVTGKVEAKTQLSGPAVEQAKETGMAPAPTALTAVAELDLLHDIPELPQFGGTLAGALLKALLPFELPELTEANKALSKTSATILEYVKDSLTATYSAENPSPELLKTFFDDQFKLNPLGQFIKSALSVEGASGPITAFLSSSLSKMLAHFKGKALNADLQIPAVLLEPKAPDRAEKISKYMLGLIMDEDSLPLPPMLEELRAPLYQLLSSAAAKQTSTILPKLDAALSKIQQGAMLGKMQKEAIPAKLKAKISESLLPVVSDIAGVLLKSVLPAKFASTQLNTALKGASKAFLTYLQEALKGTYSAENKPPETLKAFFDDQFQLNQLGQSIQSAFFMKGTDEAIGRFLATTLFSFLIHFEDKANLQIPEELLNLDAHERPQKISKYLLDLILDKEDLPLPPVLIPLRGALYEIISKIVEEQISVHLPKFDALLRIPKEPLPKEPLQKQPLPVTPATVLNPEPTVKLLEELGKYLPDIGSAVGQALLNKAILDLQPSLENDINRKKEALKLKHQFSEGAVNFPNKILSELMTFLHKELKNSETAPPPILEGLFSKTDGTYVLTPIGETLFLLLEREENRNFIVSLLEVNILSLLTNICGKKLNPEDLLDKFSESLGSLGQLLSAKPEKSEVGAVEPPLTDLAPLLQSCLKDLLPSLQILTLPFLPPEVTTKPQVTFSLEDLMMNLLGKGIQAALQKAENNIPKILNFMVYEESSPEIQRILPSLWDQIKSLRHPRQYPREKLTTLSNNAFLVLQNLFPDAKLPKFLIKAIVKMSIRYIEIPPHTLLNAILTTASEEFSIEKFLMYPPKAKAEQAPSEQELEKLTARQFIRTAIKAQKKALKEKLEEKRKEAAGKKKVSETEIEEAKNTRGYRLRLGFKIFLFGLLGHVLPYFLARSTDKTIIQRTRNLISQLRQSSTKPQPSKG